MYSVNMIFLSYRDNKKISCTLLGSGTPFKRGKSFLFTNINPFIVSSYVSKTFNVSKAHPLCIRVVNQVVLPLGSFPLKEALFVL